MTSHRRKHIDPRLNGKVICGACTAKCEHYSQDGFRALKPHKIPPYDDQRGLYAYCKYFSPERFVDSRRIQYPP
ncbi:MAG: hypothetical protein ISS48_03835 [Candidatus Aenigmarchaeota archaeon]|nr:hypothetical protein [Candidatus Aenigmarchaeota archaeon]